MDITIRVHPRFSARVGHTRLSRIARKTLRIEGADAALTVYVTSDAEIRVLNRKFHSTNAPTDVLSFPTNTDEYLGDIVISYERARAQAHAAGWRTADELDLLTVHGILHLLGYGHTTPRARKKMWKRQEEILGGEIRQ